MTGWRRAIGWVGTAIILTLACDGALADEPTQLPFDEAAQDPSLQAFRDALLAAVVARDSAAVAATAAADFQLGLDGATGPDALRAALEGRSPEFPADGLWQELEAALRLGGGFWSLDSFCAPYICLVELPDEMVEFDTVFVVKDQAKILAAAEPGAATIAEVSYAILAVVEISETGWVRVALSDGREGYLAPADYRTPWGYRLYIDRIEGDWKLTFFGAGD